MSPVKEPDFFSRPSLDAAHMPEAGGDRTSGEDPQCESGLRADLDRYTALFAGAGDVRLRGEASAIYLGHPTAAEHIRRYIPDARLVAILRDPAQRAHSHCLHAQRIRAEFTSAAVKRRPIMEEFIEVVERAYRDGFHQSGMNLGQTDPEVWVGSGFYYEHLTRFRSIFPAEQIRVVLYEDLRRDADGLMREIYGFLGVDASFRLPTTAAFNATVVPRNRKLFRFFTTRNPVMHFARSIAPPRLRAAAMRTRNRLLGNSKPTVDPELRRKLIDIYREDITKLQCLLDRDLSSWLNPQSAN